MKSPENFKPFTINTQPDAGPEPVPRAAANIPNIHGSNSQAAPKPVDIPNFSTPHPAKETLDFSKAENPDDFTHKVREHQKHPSFASKIVKTEVQDLGERARKIRKRHKNIGAKTLATVLATTTIFTAAGAIKRDKKDVNAATAAEKAPVEDSVDYRDIEDQIFSFDEDTNEVTIHQKTKENVENTKSETPKAPKAEAAKENQEDSIEMDMDVELDLTDSMEKQLQKVKKIYDEHLETYKDIAERVERDIGLKIPPEMICAIHYRESSCDFTTYLHNGEKLGKPTTLVPAGIEFHSFTAAAVDAIEREIKQFNYNTNRFHLKNDLSTLSSIAMFTETFNGTGARDYHDSYSSYVYTGTNKYHGGMYTSDSSWSSSAMDRRPGTIPIFLYLHQPAEE